MPRSFAKTLDLLDRPTTVPWERSASDADVIAAWRERFAADAAAADARPAPLVIAGPSGVGKGTLIDMLMKGDRGDRFGFSVSHTTRGPRPGEVGRSPRDTWARRSGSTLSPPSHRHRHTFVCARGRGEVDGTHYHFATKDDMRAAIDEGAFIEHAEVDGPNGYAGAAQR